MPFVFEEFTQSSVASVQKFVQEIVDYGVSGVIGNKVIDMNIQVDNLLYNNNYKLDIFDLKYLPISYGFINYLENLKNISKK